MDHKRAFFFLIAMAVALYGCATLSEFIQEPKVTLERISIKDLSLFEGTLLSQFKVTNPNPIGATIGAVSYDLKINDRDFMKDVMDKGITLKAGGTEMVELPITIRFLDLFESAAQFMKSERLTYDLSGSIGIGPFAVPYRKKGVFVLPKLPSIQLEKARISQLSLQGASMIFTFHLKNSNPFPVDLGGLNYGIKLAGETFAQGSAGKISALGQKGESRLEVPIQVDFLKLGFSAYKILTDASSEYELFGKMNFDVPRMGERSFPFQVTGQVPFYK